jgi:hypothetical protein
MLPIICEDLLIEIQILLTYLNFEECRLLGCGARVDILLTDVSQERIASIFRV